MVDAKIYLKQLKLIDTVISQKMLELDELRENAKEVKGMEYSFGRVRATPQNSQEAIICKYLDLEDEINQEISRFIGLKHTIINQIQGLKDIQYVEVLFKTYVEYKTHQEVASEMHLAYGYVNILHSRALKAFTAKYGDLEKLF